MSETCRLQGRSAYAWLVAAMEASFRGEPAPELLPADTATAATDASAVAA